MEKRELKFYETPQMEVVEMEAEVALLAESGGSFNDDDGGADM